MKRSIQLMIILFLVLSLGLAACSGSQDGTSGKSESSKNESSAKTESEAASKPAENTSTAPAESSTPAESSQEAPVESTVVSVEESVPKFETVHLVFGYFSVDSKSEIIWNEIRRAVAGKGVELELVTYGDPTKMYTDLVNRNGLDLIIGTASDLKKYSDVLTAIGYTTCYPYNIYSAQHSSISELSQYDRVAYPGTSYLNNPRMQKLMEAAGLIKLKKDPGNLTVQDVEEHVYIQLGMMSSEVHNNFDLFAAAILPAYPDLPDPIFEDPTVDDPENWNILLTSVKLDNDPAMVNALSIIVDAYHSDTTREIVLQPASKVDSLPIVVGWDIDLLADYR